MAAIGISKTSKTERQGKACCRNAFYDVEIIAQRVDKSQKERRKIMSEWIMAHPNMFFAICVFALWVIGDAVSDIAWAIVNRKNKGQKLEPPEEG